MAKDKKPSLRKCIVCASMKEKKDLIKLTKTKEGEISLENEEKLNGRGAYICKGKECVENLIKKHSLDRSFKCHVSNETYEKILEEIKKVEIG